MAHPTFGELIEGVQLRLGEVQGVSTELYSEGFIGSCVQDAFDLVFDRMWVPEYMVGLQRTLDGVDGVTTVAVADTTASSYISRWVDIQLIFPALTDRPLRLLPTRINPLLLTGTYPRYVSVRNDTKLIQFWPKASTGNVYIVGRQKPEPFATLTESVKIDRLLLVLGAAWLAIESDSTSPGMAENMQKLFESRFKTVRGNASEQPIELAPSGMNYPTQWEEMTY